MRALKVNSNTLKVIRCSTGNQCSSLRTGQHGGPKIYNHGQESGDKFALLAFLRTCQKRIQPLLPKLTWKKKTENTPNANMADRSVGARDESNGSEASED